MTLDDAEYEALVAAACSGKCGQLIALLIERNKSLLKEISALRASAARAGGRQALRGPDEQNRQTALS